MQLRTGLLLFFPYLPGALADSSGQWGTILLGMLAVGSASVILYVFLNRSFGRLPAIFAVLGLLANWVFISRGSDPLDALALLLQAAVLFLLSQIISGGSSRWRALLLGGIFGLAVSLRLPLAGLGLVTGFFLLSAIMADRSWGRVASLLEVTAGFAIVWFLIAVYLVLPEEPSDLFWQAYHFNLYSGVSNLERLRAFQTVITALYQESGFFTLGFLAWLVVFPFLFLNEERFRAAMVSRWMGAFFLVAGALLLLNGLVNDQTGSFYVFSALSLYRLAVVALGLALEFFAVLFLTGQVRRFASRLNFSRPVGKRRALFFPLAFALVDLPVQCIFSSLTGQADPHNFIPLLLSLTILMALLAYAVSADTVTQPARTYALVWLAILALLVLAPGLAASIAAARDLQFWETLFPATASAWRSASPASLLAFLLEPG